MPYQYFLAALIGYLLGCLNPAYFMTRVRDLDIKAVGNGNPGASNITLNLGLSAGAFVASFDIAKAIGAFALAAFLFPGFIDIGISAAIMAVIGHMFPFYLRFQGGKGFAAFIGLTLCVDIRFALILLLAAIALAFLSNYIITATFSFIFALPVYTAGCLHDFLAAGGIAAVSIIIFIKHIENLRKIKAGTEPKLRAVFDPRKG